MNVTQLDYPNLHTRNLLRIGISRFSIQAQIQCNCVWLIRHFWSVVKTTLNEDNVAVKLANL